MSGIHSVNKLSGAVHCQFSTVTGFVFQRRYISYIKELLSAQITSHKFQVQVQVRQRQYPKWTTLTQTEITHQIHHREQAEHCDSPLSMLSPPVDSDELRTDSVDQSH